MTIELYNNSSDEEHIVKDITLSDTLTGALRGPADVMTPEILIDGAILSPTVNYAKIVDWDRYYFIRSKESVRTGGTILKLEGDPCMTFASNIKALSGIIRRQENDWNLYIDDGSFTTYANDICYAKNFPTGLDGVSYILVTVGS